MCEKNLWFAFGIGAAIGAGFALLYAPQSGVATRNRLRRGIDDAGECLEDAGDYLKDQAERLSKEAHKAIKLTQHYADTAVDLASGTAKSVKHVKAML